jgi:hypothetical protein
MSENERRHYYLILISHDHETSVTQRFEILRCQVLLLVLQPDNLD